MGDMKKHPLLKIDFHSTLKLSVADQKSLHKTLSIAAEVFAKLLTDDVIKLKKSQKPSYEVSLLLCGDSRIQKLNRDHRGKDKVTDVLSFPAHENLRTNVPTIPHLHLGDLAISFPQTKRQAKQFSIGTWDEFIHLFFHGLLHLMGYDHELSAKEEKLMQRWESQALDIFSAIKKGSR